MFQLLQVMPDTSMWHERPECSRPGPWQGCAANIPETQSEPVHSAALSFIYGGVLYLILAVFIAMLGCFVFELLKQNAALRTSVQWTVLGFLFVYCVFSYRAVNKN